MRAFLFFALSTLLALSLPLAGCPVEDDDDSATDDDDFADDDDATDDDDSAADDDDAATDDDDDSAEVDEDGDGYLSGEDCNDLDADVNPDAEDTCDGLDNDCSGQVDDGAGCDCGGLSAGDVHQAWFVNGRSLLFCGQAQDHTGAYNTCDSFGYHLVSIGDEPQNNLIVAEANAGFVKAAPDWYIGYDDIEAEGTFVWDDGTTTTWTNWFGVEPDDEPGDADCAVLELATGTWADVACESTHAFVCESDAAALEGDESPTGDDDDSAGDDDDADDDDDDSAE